jgi:hypothetical protein
VAHTGARVPEQIVQANCSGHLLRPLAQANRSNPIQSAQDIAICLLYRAGKDKKGEGCIMAAIIIAALVLLPLAGAGLWLGLRIAAVLREQFEELMPQRMVDYAGFVKMPLGRD